uniref:Uncharacterized protein n=1 Tax=Anguilla anguilla TaxID=7936 RepID=A0A0E9RJF2_ANGAN
MTLRLFQITNYSHESTSFAVIYSSEC